MALEGWTSKLGRGREERAPLRFHPLIRVCVFQVPTALQGRPSFRLASKWKWTSVTSVTATTGTGGSRRSAPNANAKASRSCSAPSRRGPLPRRGRGGCCSAHVSSAKKRTHGLPPAPPGSPAKPSRVDKSDCFTKRTFLSCYIKYT